MKLQEIEALVSDGESEQIELKKTTGQRTAGAETACAMLNGQGGFVFFGVRSGGRIEGQQVADHTLQQVVAELGSSHRSSFSPRWWPWRATGTLLP